MSWTSLNADRRTLTWAALLVGDQSVTPLAETELSVASRTTHFRVLEPALRIRTRLTRGLPDGPLQQVRDECRPAGLMTGAETSARVAVEKLIKKHVLAPVRISLELVIVAQRWSRAVRPA